MSEATILSSLDDYLNSVRLSRSENTARTYRNAVNVFVACLHDLNIDPITHGSETAEVDWIADFAKYLRGYAPASERLYLTAIAGWYEYLAAEDLAEINLPRLRLLIRRRSRKPGQRLPQFPRHDIERILEHAQDLAVPPDSGDRGRLRAQRDRAYLFTLADTGVRVHEAVGLRRGDIDWNEGRALLIGKGDQEAVVRFSRRALRYLKTYLDSRNALDGSSGRPLRSLPLFARHDKGAGTRVLPISTTTGRAIVHQRAAEALGGNQTGVITPHSFRHYFVTTVLRGSGGNLKLAQELARHRSIAVTQRYAHLSDDELDRGYHEIFEKP
jgi:site-specific recombinase XerD